MSLTSSNLNSTSHNWTHMLVACGMEAVKCQLSWQFAIKTCKNQNNLHLAYICLTVFVL